MRYLCLIYLLTQAAFAQTFPFTGAHSKAMNLAAGQTVEVYAGIPSPSQLPANGRIAVSFGPYRKVLHALDPDFYLVYRAPKAGRYTLNLAKVENEEPDFNKPRWRESGSVAALTTFPRRTPWPAGAAVAMRASIKPVNFGAATRGALIEIEPNDSIADAQPIVMGAMGGEETLHITGGADDIEYFDNGDVGTKGLDWFRVEYKGKGPRLFTANLALPDPLVVAQVQLFTADGKEYREGANSNERVHQQLEGYRTAMSRTLQPGGVYFLKVESNSPGYDLELRLRQLAPYKDPREAVKQSMYDHISQVDAWLLNRPRGAAVERRIRDTGNLMGTHCMSCHTQSGVWGPVGAIRYGYMPENIFNFRHLINLAYQSLRPTNELIDAANNTSLAPLDLGDGPAGTRVAGFNIATLETVLPPRRLHSAQQTRTANFILQSSDPSGINAAGQGSNVGLSVVYRFAGTILARAYEHTHNERYLTALEEKAEKLLGVNAKYTDDLGNRVEFFQSEFPRDYVAMRGGTQEAQNLTARIRAQVTADAARLRQIQRPDGAWQFTPGMSDDYGHTWKISLDEKEVDPAPTALALTALAAVGYTPKDPVVAKGVEALLRMQDSFGRWNAHALTGFVTTAYAIHALARLYPEQPVIHTRAEFEPKPNESLLDTVARFRALAHLGMSPGDVQFLDLILPGVKHSNPQVRYWAFIALGALHNERAVPEQIAGLEDPVKMVREAARWGMRQTLLDDKGWDYLFPALASGGDLLRSTAAGALILRADGRLTHTAAGWQRLTSTLDHMMNDDKDPAVRAWATRAAWNWWIWNPPVRPALNAAFLRSLEAPEQSAMVETAKRYQTEALFIVNGHRANGSKEHQYPELASLFAKLNAKLDRSPDPLLVKRLVNIAGTYYNMSGGDGGPGQMGYITDGSAEAIGKAVYAYWNAAGTQKDHVKLALEAAANATYDPLQKKLLEFSTTGPEEYRTLAATSISDPRIITLAASQEFLEPLVEQLNRAAGEPERRAELASPIFKLFTRARWNMPKTEEQQNIFFKILLPRFGPDREALPENHKQLEPMEKEPRDWYMARNVAKVVHTNPDLHTDVLVSKFPSTFGSPMEELLWLESAPWLLTYETPVPEVRSKAAAGHDAYADARKRSVDLLAKQFVNPTDPRLAGMATGIAAADTVVRNNPVVKATLEPKQPKLYPPEPPEVKALNAETRANYEYFRDWVIPELERPNRDDQFACLGCHSVPGRVPSMELKPAEQNGFMLPKNVYENWRILSDRVNENSVEESKLLRKPLNVQSGKEDGHQGGRRFNPNDRGYEIIRKWALDTAALKQHTTLSQAK